MDADRSKSLTELENQDWGPPTYQSSLVINVHRLRNKPLKDFTTEDLRLMIGQKIGLNYLVPLAFERLESDPLADGDCYAGDLLRAVLEAGERYWLENNARREDAESIAARAAQRMQFDDEITVIERTAFENALRAFQLSSGKDD